MKKLNILLVSTLIGEGGRYVKHGLGLLSSCLKKEGHRTLILNDPSRIGAALTDFRPEVVGISGLSNSYPQMLRCAEATRAFSRRVLIFAGGVAPTLAPDDFDVEPASHLFDYVCCGEAEITFMRIMEDYAATETLPKQRRIKGEVVLDLDRLPFVDRHGYEKGEAKHRLLQAFSGRMYTMINSRRCRMNCRFCSPASRTIFGGVKKLRSVDHFLAEIRTLPQSALLMIHDDNLIENHAWAEEFAQKFRPLARPFICQGYPGQIVRCVPMLEHLKRVGLSGILVGIESGSDRMLRYMNKGTTRAVNEESADVLHRLGIGIQANLMFGCPTETYDEMMETVQMFNEHIYPALPSPAIYTPYPGSAWYEELKQQGLITIEDYGQYERTAKTSGKIAGVNYADVQRAISQLRKPSKPTWKRRILSLGHRLAYRFTRSAARAGHAL